MFRSSFFIFKIFIYTSFRHHNSVTFPFYINNQTSGSAFYIDFLFITFPSARALRSGFFMQIFKMC
ncbi:hypothetical protein CLOHYLEM_07296 [[Clostridium] hylemonae DSM 15053]|uniref:Uncharacterized protein n=1 Tax=[Clostridium] hylemonae DSM 15053 TaxID=553973 RepID=C0C5C0_9FIRM|nr:hypothetical protein CLOHYLEM_07296 [[Clostridium] hylemonae DSM 15053]